jgi:hypothetical protein
MLFWDYFWRCTKVLKLNTNIWVCGYQYLIQWWIHKIILHKKEWWRVASPLTPSRSANVIWTKIWIRRFTCMSRIYVYLYMIPLVYASLILFVYHLYLIMSSLELQCPNQMQKMAIVVNISHPSCRYTALQNMYIFLCLRILKFIFISSF